AESNTAPGAGFRGQKLIDRLAPEKRGDLLGFSAEQHYLRVYTQRADDLILMRFADALDLVSEVEGMQLHRSHWAAKAGTEQLLDDQDGVRVKLINGVELPISRPNVGGAKIVFGD
ncbi:LytTR family DNA-binding domain-containing protein, partial [cf. Phormidesmis sp. LEGE 11477]|uniref:LytTR family DNA-binding domain-containing protein n=1 Tax=cf. Phormidesmis sp. LEGE 11477 TaxID=1828680 RepID=UPI00187F96DD